MKKIFMSLIVIIFLISSTNIFIYSNNIDNNETNKEDYTKGYKILNMFFLKESDEQKFNHTFNKNYIDKYFTPEYDSTTSYTEQNILYTELLDSEILYFISELKKYLSKEKYDLLIKSQ